MLPDYAFNVSVSGWGWTHLVLGAVVAVAGLCLLLPYFPVWSIIVIALDVFVIWALLMLRRHPA